MQVDIRIFLLLTVLLSGLPATAQKAIYIRPSLGMHSPLSKLTYNGYKPFVSLYNNKKLGLTLKYELGVEYVLAPARILIINFSNGNAGFGMGVKHTRPCMPGGPPPNPRGSDEFIASGYNNKRIITAFRIYPKKINYKKSIQWSIETGVGIDFKSSESDTSGRLILIGPNQCGELFYLEDQPRINRKTGLILPIQVNVELIGRQRLMISVFYHQGLTKQYIQQIDYITPSYTDKSLFKVKGTSFGFKVSYAIRVWKQKTKPFEN